VAPEQRLSKAGGLGLCQSGQGRENNRTGQALCIRAHLEPAAKAAGIPGKIGWHTFRHTFATFAQSKW